MNIIDHAKKEFKKLGYTSHPDDNDPDSWIQQNVLELLEVFSNQGHSGFSAAYAIDYFEKLANHSILSPIMCTDDEWDDVSELYSSEIHSYQNNRLSSVFKDGNDGKPYYIDAIIFVEPNGDTYHGTAKNNKNEIIYCSQTIKLPFTPKKFYINVDANHRIIDESQLKNVWNYYEKQETKSYLRLKKLNEIENDNR